MYIIFYHTRTKPMQVIILCGGLGTRLREVVADVPKPMAPIGDKPFLQIKLDQLIKYNIGKVVLATGYKEELIQQYFGNEYKGIKIVYSTNNLALGTGGAIKKALQYIDDDDVIVMNGDVFFELDLGTTMQLHKSFNSVMTMAVKPMHNFDRYSFAVTSGHKMIDFKDKQPVDFGYINIGCYIVNKHIFDNLTLPENFTFEADYLVPNVLNRPHFVYYYTGYFVDIGIPQDYFAFTKYLENKK